MKVCSTLKFGLIVWLFASIAQAQSIDISKFYYRDYLDFGQGYGAFNGRNSGNTASNGTTLTGKDGTQVSVPNVPNFSASSNYGSLTSVGRGFAVTANHVSSPESVSDLRKWGLTDYNIAQQPVSDTSGNEINGVSKPYGSDTKFLRFDKYVIEGQVDLLDIDNTTSQKNLNSTQENQNLATFKDKIKDLQDDKGNIYLYQAGSGIVSLRGTNNPQGTINPPQNGEMRGGGFGNLIFGEISYNAVNNAIAPNGESRGIHFAYLPNTDFNNRISSGDSGSGIYAYDNKNQKWILLGVTSMEWGAKSYVSFASNKDLQDYKKNFEQEINLKIQDPAVAYTWALNGNNLKFEPRGDTPKQTHTLQNNKDIIFRGGGKIEVQSGIYRNNSGYAGGFVFEAENSASAKNPTKYIFTNKDDKTANIFAGSGLDIGENVVVEWALRNKSNDSLHKIGKGELIVKTNYTPDTSKNENLGTLKIGEGKVTLDTDKKAFDNIYITSGRGELALKAGKAEALGATKDTNSASGANSYKLAQDSTDKMGFYFGKGGGKFDLAGNSLVLNTIAANDSKAIITNSSGTAVNLEIEGLGYTDGTKTTNKADTIIHASIGDNANGASGTNGANLNLIYKGDKTPINSHSERSEESINTNLVDSSATLSPQNDNNGASLIFDGHINIKGELKAKDGNIVLQGHPTTHATISDKTIREQIQNAESGTSQKMPDYMDLSKPSTLKQPDWDSRNFSIKQGITLTNATLMVGKAANVTADINADNTSQIYFGGKHFIDERDGKNVIGSGFSYQQGVTSDELKDESYKDSSYSGTIKADGTTITSKFFDFTPNLELTNKASLDAKYLTLTQSSTMNFTDSSAKVENLIFKGFTNDNFTSKFTLNGTSTFSVTQALSFDKSTFNLDNLKTTTINNLTLPTEYNLYAFNGSQITAKDFQNTNANAEFVFDGKSTTFNAANGVSFQSAKISVQNGASFNAQNLNFTANSIISLADSGKLTLTGDLQTQDLNLNLSNSSTMSAKNLTLSDESKISLDNSAKFTLENALTSKNLSVNASNQSTFTASTLNASGVLNLNADANSSITLITLSLQNGELQNISQNVDITTLNLDKSTAKLGTLGKIQNADLKNSSNLHFDELNLNTSNITLTSDTTSQAHIKKLIYDTTKAQTNGTKTAPQSNLVVSEKFELKNVGQNLSTTTGTQNTQGAQGTEQEKLEKDLFALEFSKNLELKNGASLDISFADKVTKENLLFDKDYKIFSASTLIGSNLNINFTKSNGASFNETDFYATGKLDKDKNAFFVQFVRENPRNFSKLNPHINPAYSPFLEILLQHNKFDKSIDKAVNMSDYTALNQRLAQIDTSLKTIANADSAALKTLPLLQKQEINARIQQNRFTTAKFALAKITNPAQKSDIVPTLLYLDENERQNRVWSGASASFFGNGSDKFSLQSVSIGYDRKLFGDEFLLGILASLTNTQLSSDETSLNPKIYTLALYSDALFRQGELQNELSFSLLNGDKGFESENGSYKSFYGFFESVYKVQTAFLPQSIKPIVLGRVNLRHFDEFSTATYKQKADDDISVDLGVGVEWLWQRESGFYSASFVAERDIYHSQKERLMSLTGAQKFVAYETNEPSFAYQLYLAGLENFKNGIYLRYGLSGFVDSKAYKGFKADVQVGYKF